MLTNKEFEEIADKFSECYDGQSRKDFIEALEGPIESPRECVFCKAVDTNQDIIFTDLNFFPNTPEAKKLRVCEECLKVFMSKWMGTT